MTGGRIEWHHVGASGYGRKRRVTDKQRIRSKIYNLSHDISALRQQIQELTTLRAVLYTRALYTRYDGDGSIVAKAREFMTLMRHGYRTTTPRMRDCLYAVLDDDVKFGPREGRDNLLSISDQYLAKFESIEFTFFAVSVVAHDPTAETCTVRVEGQSCGAVDDETFAKTPLALLGVSNQMLVVRASVDLYFDGRGCIVRNDVCVDYAALHSALSLQAVEAATVKERSSEGEDDLADEDTHIQARDVSQVERLYTVDETWEDTHSMTTEGQLGGVEGERHSIQFLLT